MKLRNLHRWDVTAQEAVVIQRDFASQVSFESAVSEPVRYVAGIDLSPPDDAGKVKGAVVVRSYPELEVEEVRVAEGIPGFPYIPGLLSFRESPVLMSALEKLELTPDILLVDGHGLAHPRRFGIACHIGLLADTTTIGCAKSILRGRHGPLGREVGSQAELVDRGEVVGIALRTRVDVTPIYVTVGHKVDLPSAVHWALACCKGLRLPEPTRLAHQAAAGRLPEGRAVSKEPVPVEQSSLL